MRIGVVGAGGAGGYFAHRWTEAGHDVITLARGSHLEAIRRHGLALHSPAGGSTVKIRATNDPAALAEADLVVFATKTWQLPAAVADVHHHLHGEATVMGIQNGVESVDVFSALLHPGRVLGATCRILSYVEELGVVRHVGVQPTITLGEPGGGVSLRVRDVARALRVEGKVSIVPSDDIVRDLWQKFLFFSAISGVGSVKRATIDSLMSDPETRALVRAAIHETAAVGRAHGVTLPPGAEDAALAFLDAVPPGGTSSMHRDFEAGRRTELEALSGLVSRRGRELEIPTPTHDLVYESLLPLELRARVSVSPSVGITGVPDA